jgi:hypothetical protein
MSKRTSMVAVLVMLAAAACQLEPGVDGADGADGVDGTDGTDGNDGTDGDPCSAGATYTVSAQATGEGVLVAQAMCDEGDLVLGGGCSFAGFPIVDSTVTQGACDSSIPMPEADGWECSRCIVANSTLGAFAVCLEK